MFTISDIGARLTEAADTLRRLPTGDGKWRVGLRSAWPDVVRAFVEEAMRSAPRVRLAPPHPKAIDHLDEVMTWIGWLTEPQRRIAWALASGIPATKLARMIGCHRNTIANRQAAALRVIADRLNGVTSSVGEGHAHGRAA